MPLPCPGPDQISLLDIQNEFGGSYFDFDNPYTQIAEYYRGGLYVEDNPTNANVPTSGQISFADFFCSSSEVVITLNGKYENLVVRDLFGGIDGVWGSSKRKRLVLTYNAIVYSNKSGSGRSDHALIIDNNFGGSLIIENNGQIIGASGDPGKNGGNAVFVNTSGSKQVTFNNLSGGLIAGGGGGGGNGGNGNSENVSSYIQFSTGTVSAFGGIGGIGAGYRNSELVSATGGASSYAVLLDGVFNNFGDLSVTIIGTVRRYTVSNGGTMNIDLYTGNNSERLVVSNGGNMNIDLYTGSNSNNFVVSNGGNMFISNNMNIDVYLGDNSVDFVLSNGGNMNIDLYVGNNCRRTLVSNGRYMNLDVVRSSSSNVIVSNGANLVYNSSIVEQSIVNPSYNYVYISAGSVAHTFTPSGGKGGNGGYYGSNGSPGDNGTTSNGTAGGAGGAAIIGARNLIGTNDGVVYGSIID